MSVFGEKLTYRKLSEAVMLKLATFYPADEQPLDGQPPAAGGNIGTDLAVYTQHLQERFPFLGSETAKRLVTTYGSRVEVILRGAGTSDLGRNFGERIYTERNRLSATSMNCQATGEDILWRRIQDGPAVNPTQQESVSARMWLRSWGVVAGLRSQPE